MPTHQASLSTNAFAAETRRGPNTTMDKALKRFATALRNLDQIHLWGSIMQSSALYRSKPLSFLENGDSAVQVLLRPSYVVTVSREALVSSGTCRPSFNDREYIRLKLPQAMASQNPDVAICTQKLHRSMHPHYQQLFLSTQNQLNYPCCFKYRCYSPALLTFDVYSTFR